MNLKKPVSLPSPNVWQHCFRVSARMGALEAELKSYTGAGGGSGGASTDAVRNLVYDTLPKILLMMSKFHDEIRDVECDGRLKFLHELLANTSRWSVS